MDDSVQKLETFAALIVEYAGGADNISHIASGNQTLLSLTVKHHTHIKPAPLEKLPIVKELLIEENKIILTIRTFSADDLAMAIRLCDNNQSTAEETERANLSYIDRLLVDLQMIFTPLLGVLIAGGILQGILVVVYTTGIFTDFNLMDNTLSTLSGSIYHFLPILTAISSARYYKMNPYIAVSVAILLMQPFVTQFISESILKGFLGFPLLSEHYANSILPILLLVPMMAYVERTIRMPQRLDFLMKPFLILVIGLAVGIFFLRPMMTMIGNGVVGLMEVLNSTVPWTVPATLGLFGPIMIVIGGHYGLISYVGELIQTQGYDNSLGPAMLAVTFAHSGVAFAIAFKAPDRHLKHYAGASFVMAALGVSQPAIFGIELLLKWPFVNAMLAAGVGGLTAGWLGLQSFYLVNPNLASLFSFQDGNGNLLKAFVVMAVSFALGFLLTWFNTVDLKAWENFSAYQE